MSIFRASAIPGICSSTSLWPSSSAWWATSSCAAHTCVESGSTSTSHTKRSLRSRPIRAAKRLRAAKRSRSAGGELVAQDAIPLQIDDRPAERARRVLRTGVHEDAPFGLRGALGLVDVAVEAEQRLRF